MASEGQFSELLLDQTYRVISNLIVFVYKASNSFVLMYVWNCNHFPTQILYFELDGIKI